MLALFDASFVYPQCMTNDHCKDCRLNALGAEGAICYACSGADAASFIRATSGHTRAEASASAVSPDLSAKESCASETRNGALLRKSGNDSQERITHTSGLREKL